MINTKSFDRRSFLKALSYTGLLASVPMVPKRAQAASYRGTFFISVHAGGGWDPTSHCDPKGALSAMDTDPMNHYLAADIETAGNIRYAPFGGNQAFFQKWYSKLLVINGVDNATNGHDSGTRYTGSGFLAEGYPALSALVAASLGPQQPLAFITNGGYDLTQGLVSPTRAGDSGALSRIAYPDRLDANDANSQILPTSMLNRVHQAQKDQLESLRTRQVLPTLKKAMGQLHLVQNGENEIKKLIEYLPNFDNSNNPLRRQAQLAIAAYKAGVCVSANLSVGGFDTHSNHDAAHANALTQLTEGVDFLMEEAARQGVSDKIVVAMGSDFGRTPGYNDGNGKDHWSITSMMLMGKGIRGNRVIGSTDERHRPHTVDPTTLTRKDSGGIRIKPEHIHRALRKLLGVDNVEAARTFPLIAEDLNLFA